TKTTMAPSKALPARLAKPSTVTEPSSNVTDTESCAFGDTVTVRPLAETPSPATPVTEYTSVCETASTSYLPGTTSVKLASPLSLTAAVLLTLWPWRRGSCTRGGMPVVPAIVTLAVTVLVELPEKPSSSWLLVKLAGAGSLNWPVESGVRTRYRPAATPVSSY